MYVFDASSLEWQTTFRGGSGTGGDSTNVDIHSGDEENDHLYGVPALVVSEVGGGSTGGATVTAPERTPAPDSPLTGVNPDYTYRPDAPRESPVLVTSTVTESGGAVKTSVFTSTSTTAPTDPPNNNNNHEGSKIGVIVGSTVGGVAFVVGILLLLLFMWYKRRVRDLRRSYEEQHISQGLVRPDGRPNSMASSAAGRYSVVPDGRSKEDLMEGVEPTFWGMLLQPRRSLRVVNH